MIKRLITKIKYSINHFLRIFFSKKLLRLNKKKVFNQNESVYRNHFIEEKRTKLENKLASSSLSEDEKQVKISEFEAKAELEIQSESQKIEKKSKKLEERIAKTKTIRDHYHRLLIEKIQNEITDYSQENESLNKRLSELKSEQSNPENDSLIAEVEAKIFQNTKNIEILKTRERVTQDKDLQLSLSHLTMKFGGLKAVDDLSFDVKKGEIFGLIGPNGAGKTTVFNCITQFYKSNEGDVFFNDVNGETNSLLDFNTHDIINLGIVRTFQNVELVWELSVLDNLLVGAHSLYSAGFFSQLLHSPKIRYEEKVLRARAEDVLKKLDILIYKNAMPYGLPYGILKKIELARTLMTKPNLIILDEPAAGLNDAETKDLSDLIKVLRDEFNLTIFLVEHDMGLVMDVCDRICAISFGKMLAIGTPEEIQNHPKVQEAYLGGE